MAKWPSELRKTINKTSKKQLILGLHTGGGRGSQSSTWRGSGVAAANYASFEAQDRDAQAAGRGKFALLCRPDFLGEQVDNRRSEVTSRRKRQTPNIDSKRG